RDTVTILQHIHTPVNHEAGKTFPIAHKVTVEPDSCLARILRNGSTSTRHLELPVNSSHHQSAEVVGDGLRVVARTPDDDVIEAVERIHPHHFLPRIP